MFATTLTMSMAAPAQAQADAQPIVGNADNGRHKVAMCIGCHGIAGYRSSFPEVYHVPKISGQNARYIEVALKAYRDGNRKHPSMRGISGSLTDQDIADVAAYYEASGSKPPASAKAVPQPSQQVAALLKKGDCITCHGADFSKGIDGNTPKIAGQYGDYLYASLKAYRDDTHHTWGRGNPIMANTARQFSDRELKSLADYLSRLPGELATVPEPRFIR